MLNGAVVVLTSGGLDSCTLVAMAKEEGTSPHCLFVDYGQPARNAEEQAISTVSRSLRIPMQVIRYRGSPFGCGEIPGRNAFLLHAALLEFPADTGTVLIGIHAGNGYTDCSPDFLKVMRSSFEFHSGGAINVEAPLINWTKADVLKVAVDLGVPISATHSCEAANTPCGNCDSCVARNLALSASQIQ